MSAPMQDRLEALGVSASCVDVLRHLWDYLDEEVTPASGERLRAHIASCEQCRSYEGYQSCFLETIAKLRASLSAPSELREKVADTLRGEGCGCWERARRG